MKKMLKNILVIYRPYYKQLSFSLLILLFIELTRVASPYLLGKVVTMINGSAPTSDTVNITLAALGLFILESLLLAFRDEFEIQNVDFQLSTQLSVKSLEKSLSLSAGQYRSQNSSSIQTIVTQGELAINQTVGLLLNGLLPMAFKIIVTMIVLIYMQWELGIILLSGISIYLWITIRHNKKFLPGFKDQNSKRVKISKTYGEILRNLFLVQINAQEKNVKEMRDAQLADLAKSGISLMSVYYRWMHFRKTLLGIFPFLIIILGVYEIKTGNYNSGLLVTVILWSFNILATLTPFSFQQRQLMDQLVSIEKYFKLMDVKPLVNEITNPVRPDKFYGRIEFRNVSFRYPQQDIFEEKESEKKEQHLVLQNINLIIEPGQKVAFVGASGAGKSTLTSLLIRAYDPDTGQILVDGHDLRLLAIQRFRSSLGIVEQMVSLFDETLRFNICFGLEDKTLATEEKIESAAKAACIDKFYDRLTNRFETVIGENGIQLSGGERQRVGIARALIKSPTILIFDEATSSLDAINEVLIKQSIDKASQDRTTIIIAHRLSTVRDVDRIFMIEDGKVIAEGTHESLFKNCEPYRTLVQTQMLG